MTHKTQTPSSPYSHGLEKNYCVETIDLKTVKPFTKIVKKDRLPIQSIDTNQPTQLQFQFGPFFEKAIPSLKLQEPIDAIALSPLAKQALKAAHIRTLLELVTIKDALLTIKGIGRGHIDEIHEKLERYLGPSPLAPTKTIALTSLVSFLMADLIPLARSVFLSYYQLSHLFPVQPSDLHETQRMAPYARAELLQTAKKTMLLKREPLLATLQAITQAFLYPFLERRLGIAELWELEYCFFQSCSHGSNGENRAIVRMLEVLLDTPFLFSDFLAPLSKKIYADSLYTANQAKLVVDQAKKYFYNPAASFSLNSMTGYIQRDIALQWISVPEGFIEKTLRLSETFTLFRNKDIFLSLTI